jgi:hypothetical protein
MVPSNLAENLGVAAQSGALVITDPGDGKIVACVKCGGTLLVDAVAAQSAKMETPANAGFFLFVSNKSAASEDFVIKNAAASTIATVSLGETFLLHYGGATVGWNAVKMAFGVT